MKCYEDISGGGGGGGATKEKIKEEGEKKNIKDNHRNEVGVALGHGVNLKLSLFSLPQALSWN